MKNDVIIFKFSSFASPLSYMLFLKHKCRRGNSVEEAFFFAFLEYPENLKISVFLHTYMQKKKIGPCFLQILDLGSMRIKNK